MCLIKTPNVLPDIKHVCGDEVLVEETQVITFGKMDADSTLDFLASLQKSRKFHTQLLVSSDQELKESLCLSVCVFVCSIAFVNSSLNLQAIFEQS